MAVDSTSCIELIFWGDYHYSYNLVLATTRTGDSARAQTGF